MIGVICLLAQRKSLMNTVTIKGLSILFLIAATSGCTYNKAPQEKLTKINFETDNINPQGLTGNSASLRSVSYEFCIPKNADIAKRVKVIDPSVQLYDKTPGRINCSGTETLAIGNTHQSQWKVVLINLSSQDYIIEIQETFFE
jgi:hypothetical protein